MIGVDFECCPRCTGVWLDKGELGALTRSRGGRALAIEIQKERKTEHFCPKCHPPSLLFEGSHTADGEFLLDVCPRCGGLWFDRGEFPRLLKRPDS